MDVAEPVAVGLKTPLLLVTLSLGQLRGDVHKLVIGPVIRGIIHARFVKELLGIEHEHRGNLHGDEVGVAATLSVVADGLVVSPRVVEIIARAQFVQPIDGAIVGKDLEAPALHGGHVGVTAAGELRLECGVVVLVIGQKDSLHGDVRVLLHVGIAQRLIGGLVCLTKCHHRELDGFGGWRGAACSTRIAGGGRGGTRCGARSQRQRRSAGAGEL